MLYPIVVVKKYFAELILLKIVYELSFQFTKSFFFQKVFSKIYFHENFKNIWLNINHCEI